MRIGIAGISGRMGRLVTQAVAQSGATLAGGVCRSGASGMGGKLFDSAAQLAESCDVLIDFTHPSTVARHAAGVRAAKVAWVLGTTGLSDADLSEVAAAASHVPVVHAANFSPGMTLVLAVAKQLGSALPADGYDAEILETHHRHKLDAPSGTALAIGGAVAAGRGVALRDVAETGRGPHAGARRPGAIGFASLRGGQVVGEHTLLFAGDHEQIALSHTALDRSVFARGAVRAALWAGTGREPGLYSMMDVLGVTNPRLAGGDVKGNFRT